MLREYYADFLPLADRVYVEVAYRTCPDGLGWREIARMLVLHGQIAGARV